jgi:hypothetical protein
VPNMFNAFAPRPFVQCQPAHPATWCHPKAPHRWSGSTRIQRDCSERSQSLNLRNGPARVVSGSDRRVGVREEQLQEQCALPIAPRSGDRASPPTSRHRRPRRHQAYAPIPPGAVPRASAGGGPSSRRSGRPSPLPGEGVVQSAPSSRCIDFGEHDFSSGTTLDNLQQSPSRCISRPLCVKTLFGISCPPTPGPSVPLEAG